MPRSKKTAKPGEGSRTAEGKRQNKATTHAHSSMNGNAVSESKADYP